MPKLPWHRYLIILKCHLENVGSGEKEKIFPFFTYANTVHLSLKAAEELAKEGYDVEVVDLRSLNPLDKDGILASVAKTHRALVVHEDKVFAGFGGEIASIINEWGFELLDAPVKRVGATYTPVGFNRILERGHPSQ